MTNVKILVIGERQSGKTIRACNLLGGILNENDPFEKTPKALIVYLHQSENPTFWKYLQKAGNSLYPPSENAQEDCARFLNAFYDTTLFVVESVDELKAAIALVDKVSTYKQKILVIDNDVSDVKVDSKNFDVIKTRLGGSMENTEEYQYVLKCSFKMLEGRPIATQMTHMKHPTYEVGTVVEQPLSPKHDHAEESKTS